MTDGWLGLIAEEREHRHHPAVHVRLLGQTQLVEQGVDVLLHGSLGEEERFRDRGVVLSLCHVAEHFALPVGELRQRGVREVLGHMAQGQNNAAIAKSLFLTERAVEKHINSLFHKLGLTEEPDVHRRVMAVLAFLRDQT